MTWSIVARDPTSGQLGVAVSTCNFAVGAIVPWIRVGVGAVATQATSNPLYGPAILDRLERGESVDTAIRAVTAADAGRAHRQVHAIDAGGRNAAHTGASCVIWCGHLVDQAVSVAGNMLTGAAVIEASLATYKGASDKPFAERLLMALSAGQDAGGDKRGKQSAALLVHSTEPYALYDLRVDDHAEPIEELWRLYRQWHRQRAAYQAMMPTLANPAGIYDPEERQRFLAAQPAI